MLHAESYATLFFVACTHEMWQKIIKLELKWFFYLLIFFRSPHSALRYHESNTRLTVRNLSNHSQFVVDWNIYYYCFLSMFIGLRRLMQLWDISRSKIISILSACKMFKVNIFYNILRVKQFSAFQSVFIFFFTFLNILLYLGTRIYQNVLKYII